MSADRILFIEDDPHGLEVGVFNLRKAGYEVDTAEDGESGLEAFDPERHALVITDLKMPGRSGLEVLEGIHKVAPEVPVLVITAYGSIETAVSAMKLGAYDFIGKPFRRDHLLLTVQRAMDSLDLKRRLHRLAIQASGVGRPIVCRSEAMGRVLELAERVAASDATVLLTGETGTGKELLARHIHVNSSRARGPFVTVNCAAVPSDLMESELFGHEKGAFTGAARARPGRFRQAHGGTLFLDEIAELPLPLQAKLLRFLQEKAVDVVGLDDPVAVDARVVAATNQDLLQRIEHKSFRQDLYFRLNVVEIRLPSLRERPEDIEPLARHFIEQASGGRDLRMEEPLLGELVRRQWPGNVRQLENACERLVILCTSDSLSIEHLPRDTLAGSGVSGLTPDEAPEAERPVGGEPPAGLPGDCIELPPDGLSLLDLEKAVIERVLSLVDGNVSRAARYLGVPRHVLSYRMGKHGIRRPD